jgi:hypothetical protein
VAQVLHNFMGTGNSASLAVANGDLYRFRVTGAFVGGVGLYYSSDAGVTWTLGFGTAVPADWVGPFRTPGGAGIITRWVCLAYTSGTISTEMATNADAANRNVVVVNSGAQVGATAGWAVAAADDLGLMASLPASQTNATLKIPLSGIEVGQYLAGFYLVGQADSGGLAVTLDADLRRLRAAAGGVVDSSVGAMAQLAVSADTEVKESNAGRDDLSEHVTAKDTYYLLVKGTTAAVTAIALQGVHVLVYEV